MVLMDIEERRQRVLTDDDIQAIALEIITARSTVCHLEKIDPDELREAVNFYKNINAILADSKRTVRKTIITMLVVVCSGLIVLGFWEKARTIIK